MRILERTQGIKYSQIVVLVLALVLLPFLGQRTLIRGVKAGAAAGENVLESVRVEIEPVIFMGGMVVSRSRHVIAGAAMGCVSGAAFGAGAAALLGAVTGGAGLAALPPAAFIGCLAGAGAGIAMGYPLDTWSLELE
jgi:hypothetical protein